MNMSFSCLYITFLLVDASINYRVKQVKHRPLVEWHILLREQIESKLANHSNQRRYWQYNTNRAIAFEFHEVSPDLIHHQLLPGTPHRHNITTTSQYSRICSISYAMEHGMIKQYQVLVVDVLIDCYLEHWTNKCLLKQCRDWTSSEFVLKCKVLFFYLWFERFAE